MIRFKGWMQILMRPQKLFDERFKEARQLSVVHVVPIYCDLESHIYVS